MKKLSFLKKSVLAKVVIPLLFVVIALSSCTNITEYIFRNTFTVTFYANGGTGKMEDQTFSQDTEEALSKNAFIAPSGRVFAGWATDQTSGIKVYDDNQYIKVTRNLELYALWKMDQGSGAATESKTWVFDSYKDDSLRPGNNFYKYSIGRWLENPNEVGVWKTVQKKETDDMGVMYNQYQLGIEFLREMVKEPNTFNQNYPLFKRSIELYPLQDEQEKLDKNLAIIKNKLAQLDEISDVESFRNKFIESIFYEEPLWSINSQILNRKEKAYTVGATNWYIKVAAKLEKKVSLTLNDLYYLDDTDYFDGVEITELRKLLGFDESNKDVEAAYVKTICDFVYGTLLINKEKAPDTAMEDALKAYLEKEGLDASLLRFTSQNIFSNFNFIGVQGYDALSLENAKSFLKFWTAKFNLELIYNKAIAYMSMPYRFPILKAYVDKYDADGKRRDYVKNMCEEFRAKFRERLQNNTWMSSYSKEGAIKKLDEMYFLCGYPDIDKFPEEMLFTNFDFASFDSYLKLYEAIYRHARLSCLKRLASNGNEVTKDQIINEQILIYFPLEANAFYHQTVNSFTILVTNLFDPICNIDYPDAYNYAVLGATTIGHEMCHAFDKTGSKYDYNGQKKDWWAVSDKLRYEDKMSQISQLYSMFTLDSNSFLNVDGENTLTENMADFGGLSVAYDLFVAKKIAEGFSGQELIKQKKMFFESFVIGWSSIYDEEKLESYIQNDVHAPAPFRVNGCLCLMDDWYDLYDVQPGNKYYLTPDQRVILW